MATAVSLNGTTYSIPATEDEDWSGATGVDGYLIALATGVLSKAGGTFTLTADVDFGANYGLKSAYFTSRTSNAASAGAVRLARADVISWRNQANGANLDLSVNSSNQLLFNGALLVNLALGAANTVLKVNSGATASEYGLIANANIDAAAAIAYSKLNLATSIVNADINAAAAIDWSKISKTGSNLSDLATKSHTSLSDIGTNTHAQIDTHIANTSNPHSVTATQVGLGNVDNTSDATKNAAAATLTNKTFGDAPTFTEIATPSTPSAGLVKLYPKSDGNFYKLDDTGVEVAVGSGAGGSGEKNYISANPSAQAAITGWNAVGDLAVARTTTASELPREYTTATGIKITADADTQSTADYVYFDFNLDDVDLSKKLKIQWSQKTTGTYNAGDLAVVITTQADRTTALHTPVVTAIPAADGVFTTSFDSSTTAALSLVIRATTDMTADGGIVISDVIVGPGTQPQGAVVSEWVSFTPTGTWSSNTTYTGRYRRVGDTMEAQVTVSQGGPASGTLSVINMPTGFTIDTSKLSATSPEPVVGDLILADAGTLTYKGTLTYASSTTLKPQYTDDAAGGVSLGNITASAPFSFNSGDSINMWFRVPIAEWAGSGTINVAQNDVEYAYNTAGTTAAGGSDTSSFAYGPAGAAIGSIASTTAASDTTMRCRFPTAFQAGEVAALQVDAGSSGAQWFNVGDTFIGYVFQGTSRYGARVIQVNSTDVDVAFGNKGSSPQNATYAGDGGTWASISTWRWRVVKQRAGQAVGFGIARSGNSGLISAYDEGTFTVTEDSKSNLTGTAAFSEAKYTRVGRIVFVQFRITGLSVTSSATATQYLFTTSGLPGLTNTQRYMGGAYLECSGSAYLGTRDQGGADQRIGFNGLSNGTGAASIDVGFWYTI